MLPPRLVPSPRRRPARGGGHHDAAGSLSLEAAMALPVVAVCALALLQVVGVVRDALLAQDLARIGARVAATDPSDATVTDAIAAAAGDGVTTDVEITPAARGPGDTVTVTVRLERSGRWGDLGLTGRAVVRGEPILDRGGGP